jgi:hypothetical protein
MWLGGLTGAEARLTGAEAARIADKSAPTGAIASRIGLEGSDPVAVDRQLARVGDELRGPVVAQVGQPVLGRS